MRRSEVARRSSKCPRGVTSRRVTVAWYALLLGGLSATATAQAPDATGPDSGAAALDAADVEAFVDKAMSEALAQTYAPGAIVTVVEGDRLVLAKGYGVANVKTRAAIDPTRTLFRIASITKLFTTVAALRLEEQGKLDLDTDVNHYLTRVRIPDTYPEPVTARRLLTHHGGFDTAVGYMDFPDERAAQQTPEQMQRDIRRARSVTALPLYDNMGFGVLGLVVADILGVSYADAMRQEVFAPLGMNQSVVGLPDSRVEDAAHAHMRDAQWHAALIPQNVMPTSAQGGGDVSTTADDMGRFMSALLLPGRILEPATLARMTDFDTWRFNPRIPGLGLGMWQYFYRGHPAEGHRGEVNGFISRVALFRDQRIGIFISVNSTVQAWPQPRLSYVLTHLSGPTPPPGAPVLDPDGLIDGMIGRFADRYVHAPPPAPAPAPRAANEPTVEELAGAYFRLDATTHLMERMSAAMHAPRMQALPDGQFAIVGMCGPFVRKGPLYYECPIPHANPIAVGFRVEDGDRIFASVDPVGALERQPWWRSAMLTVLPIPVVTLIALSALLVRRYSHGTARRRVLGLAGLGAFAFIVALLLELQFGYDLAHGELHWLPILWRVLFPVAAALLLVSAVLTLPALRKTAAATTTRVRAALRVSYHFMLALASLALVWLIWVWGLAWPFH